MNENPEPIWQRRRNAILADRIALAALQGLPAAVAYTDAVLRKRRFILRIK